jgi:CRP/FNR family nitrogen fixation transcriptional regulator
MQLSPLFSPRVVGALPPGLSTSPKPKGVELKGETMFAMRDQELFADGEQVRHVYRIVSGGVRGFRVLSDGCREICDFYLPGDIFGIQLKAEHRIAAEAVTDTMLVVAHRSNIKRDHDRAAIRALWDLAVSDLHRSQGHALSLRRRCASGRVASFLLDMVGRIGENGSVDLPMSRQDIADYLGLTIEIASSTLAQLHASGAITLSGSRGIHVRKPLALAELCD